MTARRPRKALAGDAAVVVIMAPLRRAAGMSRPVRRAAQADGMQGVAFLHRESRPKSKPNRNQRPQR